MTTDKALEIAREIVGPSNGYNTLSEFEHEKTVQKVTSIIDKELEVIYKKRLHNE